jgi:hypothetical protein
MSKLWRGVVRTIFWSYERGSWPYDVMVLAILAFVLLTPRGWFRDQPQTKPSEESSVELISEQPGGTRTYRLDAKLLDPRKRAVKKSPQLERQTHDILAHNINDLRGQTFQVVQIVAVRGDDGSIRSYDVTIRR